MADSVATITVNKYPNGHDTTTRFIIVHGVITLNAGHYPVGGFPLSWALDEIKSTYANTVNLPTDVDVRSAANPPSGYSYIWDNVVGKLHIFVSDNTSAASGPLIEWGGQLTGTMISDKIVFTALFPKQIY